MSLELLIPVENETLVGLSLLPKQIIGKNIDIHSETSGLPELKGLQIALIGLNEYRNSFFANSTYNVNQFRKVFYELFPGNWNIKIADLGDLPNGEKVEDTYFAVKEIGIHLKQMNIIPIFIGGSHDLLFPLYQVFQKFNQLVNIASVDRSYDFSQEDELISGRSYMSRIIMDKPNVLNNYTNIGFQTYYCALEEKDLMDKLYFDGIRLGQVLDDPSITEPVFRDSDIVGFDMKCLSWQAIADPLKGQPNGLDSRTICGLTRYAGISDRINFMGIYEIPSTPMTHQLLAQMIWYFIEGVNFRVKDYPFSGKVNYQKFTVLMEDDDPLVFYKSNKTGRWWIEINILSDNKYKRHALIPCTYEDYLETTKQLIPNRWFKAQRKML